MGIIAWPRGSEPQQTFTCFICLEQAHWEDGAAGAYDLRGQRFGCVKHLNDERELLSGFADYLVRLQDEEDEQEFNNEYGEDGYEQGIH